ncbi:RidA family protein [Jannaschia sp. KMU-145]|uniref:RidA family protein n=1 Tax=Jannaschia halovivens TaxID=3388667 RepID=UPI00396B421D
MAHSFDPPDIWAPFGAFSQSVIVGTGQTVLLKGQVALDASGQIVGEGDMEMQVRQVLRNLADTLAPMGGRMSDIVALNQFTTDIAAFMACSEVRKQVFSPPYPVTTTLEVAALYDPRLLVEINGTAEIPTSRFTMPDTARALHG